MEEGKNEITAADESRSESRKAEKHKKVEIRKQITAADEITANHTAADRSVLIESA